MEQEPGKAGEPVPAAPHPDDVPTFEPRTGSENALENGSAHSEPAPVSIPAAEPLPVSPEPAPSPTAVAFEAPLDPPVPPGPEWSAEPANGAAPWEPAVVPPPLPAPDVAVSSASVSAEFPESEPAEPEPVLNTADGASSSETPIVSAAPEAIATSDDLEAPAAPMYAEVPAATEPLEAPADGLTFLAEPPPPPPVLSAWGPPPPAWPPAAASPSLIEGVPPGTADLPTPTAEPLPAAQPAEEPYVETGPNWMLAFVCLWAAGTALNEAWFLAIQVGLTPALLRNVTVMGYGVLGLGLVGFALDALSSGKKQSPAASLVKALIPALLTLAGVILLVLSNDPGRRI